MNNIINNCKCINNAKGHSFENTGYNKDLILELDEICNV